MFKYIKYSILLFSIASLVACSSYVDDVSNQSPNDLLPSDAQAANLIQGVMLGVQFVQTDEFARRSGIWSSYFTGSERQYLTYNDWNNATAGDFDRGWVQTYVNIIPNAQIAAVLAEKDGNLKLKGVSQVLEAFAFGTMADLFGDVPFSEANKKSNPVYDEQSDVYSGIQTLLDSAITSLQGQGTISRDIFYNGDSSKWIKLAYTLKARYYIHVGDYANALANAKLGINLPSDDFVSNYGQVLDKNLNPIRSFLNNKRSGYMSATDSYAASILDPNSSMYIGNDKTNNSGRFDYNYLNESVYVDGYEPNFQENGKFYEDIPLVTSGENLLILAECEFNINGFDAGLSALNSYRELLNGGYMSLGADTYKFESYEKADFENSGMVNQDNLPIDDALAKEISLQKYIALVGNIEGFTDLRRTDNLAGVVLRSSIAGFPERFIYPQVEINSNTNVPNPIPSVVTPTPVNK